MTPLNPIKQPDTQLRVLAILIGAGFTVLLETSGALDISPVDSRVRRIMDLKCPSSGEVERNRWENIPHLKATDEIKFVIGTVEDYDWVKSVESERMSWCLGDVVNIHGDVGLRGGNCVNCRDNLPVIYPDRDPTGLSLCVATNTPPCDRFSLRPA